MDNFQKTVIAAQDLAKEVRLAGQRLDITADGMIVLFHGTSATNAELINRDGVLKGPAWLAPSRGATLPHAKPKHGKNTTVLEIRVHPMDVEFSSGTGEFYSPNGLKRSPSGVWLDNLPAHLDQDVLSTLLTDQDTGVTYNPALPVDFYDGDHPDVQDGVGRLNDAENLQSDQWNAGFGEVLAHFRGQESFQTGTKGIDPVARETILKHLARSTMVTGGQFDPQSSPVFAPYRVAVKAVAEVAKRLADTRALHTGRPLRQSMAQLDRFDRPQVRTEPFKRWFGASKVRSNSGLPLIAFHGSSQSFTQFQMGRSRKAGNPSWAGELGAWFAAPVSDASDSNYEPGSAESTAEVFAEMRKGEPVIYPVYLAIENPFEVQDYEDLEDALVTYGSMARMKASLIALGHDGIVVRDSTTDGGQLRDDWVAFYPYQVKSATGNNGEFDKDSDDILMSVPKASSKNSRLGIYSALAKEISLAKITSGAATAWLDHLKGLTKVGLVKDEEINATGLREWLEMTPGKLDKGDVLHFLDEHGVQLIERLRNEDVEKSPVFQLVSMAQDKWQSLPGDFDDLGAVYRLMQSLMAKGDSYTVSQNKKKVFTPQSILYEENTMDMGENYREVLLTIPGGERKFDPVMVKVTRSPQTKTFSVSYGPKELGPYPDLLAWPDEADLYPKPPSQIIRMVELKFHEFKLQDRTLGFQSIHWPDANVVAHMRVSDVYQAGKKTLLVQEIQSDWAQTGRRHGFDSAGYKAGVADVVPNGPFVTKTSSWVGLCIKRLLVMAASQQHDQISFATADLISEAVGAGDSFKKVSWSKREDGQFEFELVSYGNSVTHETMSEGALSDRFGKSFANKIIASAGRGEIDKATLPDKGMAKFYEELVPNVANDQLRKLGFKTRVEQSGEFLSIQITNEMREKLTTDGVPLFSFAGVNAQSSLVRELKLAKQLLARGNDPQEVRKRTMWFRGDDGMWRFEISDDQARLQVSLLQKKTSLLQEVQQLDRIGGEKISDIRRDLARGRITLEQAQAMQDNLLKEFRLKKLEASRVEVCDAPKAIRANSSASLGDVLYHPTLFAAYPQLAALQVTGIEGMKGDKSASFSADGIKINANLDLDDLLSVLMHEVQHAIQDIEGFAKGGDYRDMSQALERHARQAREDEARAAYRAADEAFIKDKSPINRIRFEFAAAALESVGPTPRIEDSMQAYSRLAGEVESRNVQARLHMTPDQRQQASPESTQDVQGDRVIITFNGQDVAHRMIDVAMSFAGERAVDADHGALAKAREDVRDATSTWQAYGWFCGSDGRWRYEIDDSVARVDMDLLKGLSHGGMPANTAVQSLTYRVNKQGTYEVLLVPHNAQSTEDLLSLRGVPRSFLCETLPKDLMDKIDAGHGQDDLIGNFEPAKSISTPDFVFQGLNSLPLDLVFHHPALFSAYPEAKNIAVTVCPEQKSDAAFETRKTPCGNTVAVISLKSVGYGEAHIRSMLLHEIQHFVQRFEGFAPGGTEEGVIQAAKQIHQMALEQALATVNSLQATFPKTHAAYQAMNNNFFTLLARHGISAFDASGEGRSTMDMVRDLKRVQTPQEVMDRRELIDEYSRCIAYEMGSSGTQEYAVWMAAVSHFATVQDQALMTPNEAYQRLAGEVESRNVQKRMEMSEVQRRLQDPGQTADIPQNEQMVVTWVCG